MRLFLSYRLFLIGIVLFTLNSSNTFAQKLSEAEKEAALQDVEELIENIASDTEDSDIAFDTYLEYLRYLLDKPLNLNKATLEELKALGLLSNLQANGIINYREKFGNFLGIYELQAVPEIDLPTARAIAPFLKAGDVEDFNVPFTELLTKGTHQLFIRYQQVLQEQRGYTNTVLQDDSTLTSRYLGSPYRLYTRYRYRYGQKISYGITAEKDPGEEFFRGSQRQGFDFYSAHFYAKDIGRLKYLALGDYEIKFGQGLVMWTGLGFRKGSYVMNVARNGFPVRAYTSVNESLFFRGAAATVAISDKVEVTVFGSYKNTDGNVVVSDTLSDESLEEADLTEVTFSSLQLSGLHRTQNEVDDKDQINQINAGSNITFRTKKLAIGANVLYTKFDSDLVPAKTPNNLYRFSGDQLINASFDYKLQIKNFNFFGETAMSDNGGIATINGLLVGLDPKMSLSMVHRHYERNYQSLFSAAFGESTRPQNETGLYIGMNIRPNIKWQINAYFDTYRHPWLRVRVDGPSNGTDWLLDVKYRPSRKMEMYARFRTETKGLNAPNNETVSDFISDHTRTSLRYHVQYKFNKVFLVKSRVELSWYDDGVGNAENGYMLMQDFIYKPLSSPISFATRFALFDTESYNTRIYAYENDVLYVFSIPPYYNRGTRFYFMLRYKMFRGGDIWLRYANTYWQNQEGFSMGTNEQVVGNNRSELKLMLRFKW